MDGVYRTGRLLFSFREALEPLASADALGCAAGGGSDATVPYLIVSDIHANLEALEAVLEDARGLYDPFCAWAIWSATARIPTAMVDWMRGNRAVVIRGQPRQGLRADSIRWRSTTRRRAPRPIGPARL